MLLPSLECRLIGARVALGTGDKDTAESLLNGIDGRMRSGPAAQHVHRWYGEAMGRFAVGNRSGALSALRSGLKVCRRPPGDARGNRAPCANRNDCLRAAELGLDIAFGSGRPIDVLRWSERWRAGALHAPRAMPPRDEKLARMLANLRDTVARLERASLAGDDVRPLVARQRRVEAAIRQRSRSAEGGFAAVPGLPDPVELREAIAERVLIEYVDHGGLLHAVTGTRERFKLLFLASTAEVSRERSTLHFALRRLALRRSSQPSLEAAAALLARSCTRLEQLLITPLARDLDGRDLVIVPTGELHAVVWGLFPSLRGRAVTVSPSAWLWYSRRLEDLSRSRLSASGAGEVALIAGPRVAHTAEEIDRIRSAFYPKARILKGAAATARAVARMFEGRRLVHVAAHGTFRADNPQFSSLEMADGPIIVYDLERIVRPPDWIVLSACDAGRAEVHPGDDLMGTSAALLSLGTRAIVSSAATVPDDGVIQVMIALHEQLARGHGLARALATAQAARCRRDSRSAISPRET